MTDISTARRNIILATTSIGSIINPLLNTMVIIAAPFFGNVFNVSARDLGWLSTAFILANAIALIPATWIVDKIGYKKSYLIGSLIVAISCLLTVFASNYPLIIALRAASGLGISFVMITSVALITQIFPSEKRGFAIGLNSMMIYLGLTLGPFLGGIIVETLGWKSIFYLISPLIFTTGILVYILINTEFTNPVKKPDLWGILFYGIATFCMMFGLATITDTLSPFIVASGLILFILFIRHEFHHSNPVLHVSLFKQNKRFSRASFAALLNYSASYAVVYMMSLYLQTVGNRSATESGLIILVQALIQVIATPIAGKFADKYDSKYLSTGGMILTTIGLILLANISLNSDVNRSYILIIQILIGLGIAFFTTPNSTDIMNSVPKCEYSTASGIISAVRQYGMLISMAICMSSISIIVGSYEILSEDVYDEFLIAFQYAMYFCAGLSGIGAILSWFRGPLSHTENNA